jgi:hypothetical protein
VRNTDVLPAASMGETYASNWRTWSVCHGLARSRDCAAQRIYGDPDRKHSSVPHGRVAISQSVLCKITLYRSVRYIESGRDVTAAMNLAFGILGAARLRFSPIKGKSRSDCARLTCWWCYSSGSPTPHPSLFSLGCLLLRVEPAAAAQDCLLSTGRSF